MGSEGVAGSSRVPCVNNSCSNIPAIFPLLSDVAFFMSCFQTHSRGLSGDYALLLVCCVLERNEKKGSIALHSYSSSLFLIGPLFIYSFMIVGPLMRTFHQWNGRFDGDERSARHVVPPVTAVY